MYSIIDTIIIIVTGASFHNIFSLVEPVDTITTNNATTMNWTWSSLHDSLFSRVYLSVVLPRLGLGCSWPRISVGRAKEFACESIELLRYYVVCALHSSSLLVVGITGLNVGDLCFFMMTDSSFLCIYYLLLLFSRLLCIQSLSTTQLR